MSAFAANGIAMMMLSVGFFTLNLLLVKAIHVQYGVSFWVITLPRFVAGLILVKALFHGEQSVDWKSLVTNKWMLARGILGGIGVPFYNLCIIELGAGRSSILTSSYPIFAGLIAPFFLPEALRWPILALTALALCGMAIMTGGDVLSGNSSAYDLLAISIAIVSGLVIVIVRKLHATHNTATIFAAQCVFGFLVCLGGAARDFISLAPAAATLIIISSVCVALGQLAMTHAFKHVSVARGPSIQLIGPPMAAFGSFMLFGETLSVFELCGAALILFACYRIAVAK